MRLLLLILVSLITACGQVDPIRVHTADTDIQAEAAQLQRELAAVCGTREDGDPDEGFYKHLKEAIALNRDRQEVYAERSQGRSRRLSRRLIAGETVSLPFAAYLDWRAREYNRRGIFVVAGDFVPMDSVRATSEPPRFRGVVGPSDLMRLESRLMAYRRGLQGPLKNHDFRAIADRTLAELLEFERSEERLECHFAMTKHFLESLGFAAVNAIGYAARSEGETAKLSATLIRVQAVGLRDALALDRQAQEIHRLGVGILVNDMPEIPFKHRMQAGQN